MPNYRRIIAPGATYFFTLNTFNRQSLLTEDIVRASLRRAIDEVRIEMPFQIDAWVLLPDHLHAIWTLPSGDADFSKRWSIIKRRVSQACQHLISIDASTERESHRQIAITKRREITFWQRRFWEHMIRDENDLQRHLDYVHINPLKHGYVKRVQDWPYSTFHRYVRDGTYCTDWASDGEINSTATFGETIER